MINTAIIYIALVMPRKHIACEGFFAAISPDFISIGPAIDEVVAGPGFLMGIATRTIQGISLTFSQWVFMTSPRKAKTVSASSSLQPARTAPPLR